MTRTLWMVCGVVFGLLGVLWIVALTIEAQRGQRFRAGWICGVVGLRGGGKSLFVARLVAWRVAEGRPVVSNFSVQGGTTSRMRGWEDVILAPEGTTVVLDEAHQWAQATAGKSPDPLANWYISHSRKLGHEVWWIAQHESQIAGFLKQQTNEYVLAEKYVGSRHRARAYAPHEFRKKNVKALWTWWYSPKGAAIRVFDTLELAEPITNDRDSAEVRQQKEALRGLIRQLNARRASAGLTALRANMEEPAAQTIGVEGDGFLGSDAHDSTTSTY